MKLPLTKTQTLLFDEAVSHHLEFDVIPQTPIILEKRSKNVYIGSYSPAIPYNLGLILSNKHYVKQILKTHHLPVAKGEVFSPFAADEALTYAQNLGFPVLLRQENSQLDIKAEKVSDIAAFKTAFSQLRQCKQNILAEEYLKGIHLRISLTNAGFDIVL